MGMYQYTLRAPTKTVSGVEIGQFKYAYKCGWGTADSRIGRAASALAEEAAYKLERRGVTHFVHGDWHDGQPIYWASKPIAEYTEELRTTPIVGHLCKDGRGRWHTVMKTDEELLAAHPEVGMLQTEDGPLYYVDGYTSMRYSSLREVLQYALLKRISQR
jgi:hypothetical protein